MRDDPRRVEDPKGSDYIAMGVLRAQRDVRKKGGS